MHWKGLRINIFDGNNDSKRQTVIETQQQQQQQHQDGHSENLFHPSLQTRQIPGRRSESAPRSPRLTEQDEEKRLSAPEGIPRSGSLAASATEASTPPQKFSPEAPGLRRNRFSFRRLRHSSDPQLAASYGKAEEDVPPVPPLPAPPMIITTSPTAHESVDPIKRDNKLKIFPRPKKDATSEAYGVNSTQSNGESRHATQGSADSILAVSRTSVEEPGRDSTASRNSGGHERRPNDPQQNPETTDPRLSDSSRSDQSVGNRRGEPTPPQEDSIFSTKRFRLPWLKMNRSSVFPLPPKPRNEASSRSKHNPVDANQKFASSSNRNTRSVTPDNWEVDQVSPLPSPSRSSTRPSSPVHHSMRRNPSTKSAPSVKSFSSNGAQSLSKSRQRSSTVGTTVDAHGSQQQASPHLVSSARTSSSTSGRKSFGDLLGIPQRLRQNSEPPIPRAGSPSVGGTATPASKIESFSIPRREEDDTPTSYLARLQETIPRGAIAGVLAQSGDEFFKTALRMYMRDLSFFGDPIDMAIRKLLMEVILPKETQQIDRVLQEFSDRYHECNPGIFASSDQAYFISFSILILHTDVFNKNNKRKMQKQDYVKNTRGESVSDDILECFYENICYTPFIHIEDASVNARYLSKPRRTLFRTPSSEHLSRSSREPVDPYALIMEGKLHTLKPSLGEVMDLEDTYRCTGSSGHVDMKILHRAFAKSGILQILSPRSRPDAFMTPSSIGNPADSQPGLVDIRVAKVGLVWRKDPRKRRARSPWQEWGAVLTFSQLYFFRDLNWVKSLISQHEFHQRNGHRGTVLFKPPLEDFKPDAIMSTYDSIALLDLAYKKHKNAFVFVRHNALEEVFLANNEPDMEDWLAKLNYAAAFRTTGVRPKGMMATKYEAQRERNSSMDLFALNGSSLQQQAVEEEPISPNVEAYFSFELATASRQLMHQRVHEANEKLFVCQAQLDDLLRNARHLQILTPIHPRTREQVIMAAGRMAAKVKWVRQDIWRVKSYRSILLRDMGEEEWNPPVIPDHASPFPGSIPADTNTVTTAAAAAAAAPTSESGQPPAKPVRLSVQVPVTGPSTPSVEHHPPSVNKKPVPELSIQTDGPASPSYSVHSPSRASGDIQRPSVPLSRVSSDLPRTGGRTSGDHTKEFTKSSGVDPEVYKLEREASALSSGSRKDTSSLASRASKLTSTESTYSGGNEERVLRGAGLLELDSSSSRTRKQQDVSQTGQKSDEQLSAMTQDEQGTTRKRRSLHRTLRDSHHSHRSLRGRSKKGRDFASNAAYVEGGGGQAKSEGEAGLPRKTPSFTVHGRKASIVTFGSEWQNMSPEERLKLRKPTPSEDPRSSDPALVEHPLDTMNKGEYPRSLRRASTATRWSFGLHDDHEGVEGWEVIGKRLSGGGIDAAGGDQNEGQNSPSTPEPTNGNGVHATTDADVPKDQPARPASSADDDTDLGQHTQPSPPPPPQHGEMQNTSPAEQAVTA